MSREHLDGDCSIETGIPGSIHLTHAALAYRGFYFIWSEPLAFVQCHGLQLP
jgi:hypothetical protein